MCHSHITETQNNARPLILLVEDDTSLGRLLAEVLSQEICAGDQVFYQVARAASATTAKALLNSTPPLLCIFEHHPPMLDAFKLYDQVCALYKAEQIPAMVISNDLPYIELIRRQLNGLQKPFDLERFIQLVREMLVDHRERRERRTPEGQGSGRDCNGLHFSHRGLRRSIDDFLTRWQPTGSANPVDRFAQKTMVLFS